MGGDQSVLAAHRLNTHLVEAVLEALETGDARGRLVDCPSRSTQAERTTSYATSNPARARYPKILDIHSPSFRLIGRAGKALDARRKAPIAAANDLMRANQLA